MSLTATTPPPTTLTTEVLTGLRSNKTGLTKLKEEALLCGGHIEDTSSRDSKLKTAVINYIDQLIKLSSATKIDDQVADTHKISYDARRYYGFLVNARNNIDNLANGSKKEYGEFLTDISNCMGKIIAAIDGILMNQSENPALKEALQPHEA